MCTCTRRYVSACRPTAHVQRKRKTSNAQVDMIAMQTEKNSYPRKILGATVVVVTTIVASTRLAKTMRRRMPMPMPTLSSRERAHLASSCATCLSSSICGVSRWSLDNDFCHYLLILPTTSLLLRHRCIFAGPSTTVPDRRPVR